MKRKIKALVNKYYKKVKRDVIGCGLSYYDKEELTSEINELAYELYNDIVVQKPSTDISSPEYEEWYRKTLVFGEIMEELGKYYESYYSRSATPHALKNHYGPRD
jgi:hypothetical protein